MFGLIKMTFYFSLSFLLFSVPYQNKPLFETLYQHAYPYTSIIFKNLMTIKQEVKETTKQKFDTEALEKIDEISSTLSSIKKVKKNIQEKIEKAPSELEYHREDREKLENFFGEN